jgi:hypothetical protein
MFAFFLCSLLIYKKQFEIFHLQFFTLASEYGCMDNGCSSKGTSDRTEKNRLGLARKGMNFARIMRGS